MAEVISLFDRKKKAEESNDSKKDSSQEADKLSFADIAKRNAENQERIRKERQQKNKNVLRSYRIK